MQNVKQITLLVTLLSTFFTSFLIGQNVFYTESNEDFVNPDRGFYHYTETRASNYNPLVLNDLVSKRTTFFTPPQGNYMIKSAMVFRYFVLDDFVNSDISSTFLNQVSADFNIARQAGVRLIIRFTYTINPTTSCGASACPPYGDATKARVLAHITQLKPILQANEDVISVVQMGFIGVWGEQYYTDHFGDPSSNGDGKITDPNWQKRNEVLTALLDAVPASRMVQVRYPQLKQRFIYGINAPVNSAAITANQAHKGTNIARIGLHNDCFLASADDFGTYFDYGSSSTSPSNQIGILKPYFAADGKFTVVGGETCSDDYSPQNNCGALAVPEMQSLHYSYLNSNYNNAVNNDWESGNCMDSIKKRLGYRIIMRNGNFPAMAYVGGTYNFTLNLENIGFAAPFNERKLQLILRETTTNAVHKIMLTGTNIDTRFWHTGNINVVAQAAIPLNLPKGNYQLLLHILDPSNNNTVSNRPAYSIRLANENTWENTTGYNKLNHTITVSTTADCSNNTLMLSNDKTTSEHYENNGIIESTQKIMGNITVNYESKVAILLKPGFSVTPPAIFNAFIDGCDDNALMQGTEMLRVAEQANTTITPLPFHFSLSPNPFNDAFQIEYEIKETGTYSLLIFNTLGQLVNAVFENDKREMGRFKMIIDRGALPKGLYYVQLRNERMQQLRKIIAH